MTLLALIITALLWLGISFLFAAWFCPRFFRFVDRDYDMENKEA